MVMKNEKGITLVELLVAVVIAGIIIVPLLTIMTGTFTRTASQEKETQIAYVAQEVVERIRIHAPMTEVGKEYVQTARTMTYYFPESHPLNKGSDSMQVLPEIYCPDSTEKYITVKLTPYNLTNYSGFYEVTVSVSEDTKVVIAGENSTVVDKENAIELMTVVKIK